MTGWMLNVALAEEEKKLRSVSQIIRLMQCQLTGVPKVWLIHSLRQEKCASKRTNGRSSAFIMNKLIMCLRSPHRNVSCRFRCVDPYCKRFSVGWNRFSGSAMKRMLSLRWIGRVRSDGRETSGKGLKRRWDVSCCGWETWQECFPFCFPFLFTRRAFLLQKATVWHDLDWWKCFIS